MKMVTNSTLATIGLCLGSLGQALGKETDSSLSELKTPALSVARQPTHANRPAAAFGKPNLFGVVRYTAEQKEYIESLPIDQRPQRIGHPYGRIVRNREYGMPLFPGTAIDFKGRTKIVER